MNLSDWLSQPAVNPGYAGGGAPQPTGIKGPPVMNGYNGPLMQPNVEQGFQASPQGFFGNLAGLMNGGPMPGLAAWKASRIAAGLPWHGDHQHGGQLPPAPMPPQAAPDQANPFNVQPNVSSGYGGYAAHQAFPSLRY